MDDFFCTVNRISKPETDCLKGIQVGGLEDDEKFVGRWEEGKADMTENKNTKQKRDKNEAQTARAVSAAKRLPTRRQ